MRLLFVILLPVLGSTWPPVLGSARTVMLLHSGKVLSFVPFKKGGSDFQMLESGNTMKQCYSSMLQAVRPGSESNVLGISGC